MSRTFLSLHPYFEGGPIVGRKQANMGFIRALFRKDPFDMYHFFVDNPQELLHKWKEEATAAPLLQRGALHAFPRTQLEKRLKIVPYTVCHFSDPMTEFAYMCRARNAFAPYLFPITAVNHTISYVDYAQSTLGHVWQGCTPRDGIGCTSFASRAIMQGWYSHARAAYDLPDTWREPQLQVIPLGVPEPDLGQDASLRQVLRQQYGLAPQTALILLYGRISLVDKMDVRPLFAALRRVRVKHPELSFFFFMAGAMDAGDTLESQLRQLAEAWDIPFTLAPNPSRELKKQLFAAADIFVSPVDNIQETFGLTLVEAAQSALPVIASNWDGYKDIVVHGQTGLLVPTLAPTDTPRLDSLAAVMYNKVHQLLRSQQTAMHVPSLEQALYRLIAHEDVRKSMGAKAKERAAQLYTFDIVVDAWLQFWQKLADSPISPEQEKLIRAVKHPMALDYGKTFAQYASHHFHAHTVLHCTDLGLACLQKQAPWNNRGLAAVNLVEGLIHKFLALTQGGCSVEQLLHVAQQSPWGKSYSVEALLAHIYWMAKHDLVEYALS